MRFLTLTLHPSIDRVVEVDRLVPGGTFDGHLKLCVPSGKGVNTARSLRGLLGGKSRAKVKAVAWAGEGEAGWFEDRLAEEGVDFVGVARPCATRVGTTFLQKNGKETHVKESMAQPTAKEQGNFVMRLADGQFGKAEITAVCGSAPPKTAPGIMIHTFEFLRNSSRFLIADTNGPFLEAAGRASLDGLKGNAAEIGAWLGLNRPFDPSKKSHRAVVRDAIQIENRKSKIENGTGPRALMITLGSRGAVLATRNGLWLAKPPKLSKRLFRSATGCGDAATAGWMWALSADCNPAETLRRAVACGTAKLASADPGGLDRGLALKLLKLTSAVKLD